MKSRRINRIVMPVVYGVCVVAFLISMYFAVRFTNNMLFSNDDDLEYVDGEITENNGDNNDIPVVNTTTVIMRPYLDSSVSIGKTFYDYAGTSEEQENSIIFYEDTYMQNSGVDYKHNEVFDIVSILDGTVIEVTENEILGKTIKVRHENDLISTYQSLSEINVKQDDVIMRGQVIGKSGTCPLYSSDSNLHFELYYQGKNINPEESYNKTQDEL